MLSTTQPPFKAPKMLNNPTFKKYESSVTDMEQFGISDIHHWYEIATEYRVSAKDLVMSLLSAVQHLMGDSENELRVRYMINRAKWVTMNKLDNK
jgi:hypothetical protein